MSTEASDFRVEIIQAPPRTFAVSGGPAPIDLMSPLPGRVSLSGLGQINRAIDRNLLTFKTGDATMQLINRDGYFDDLFAFLGPTDRWTLRLFRRDLLQFTGTIMGLGSIRYDRLAKTIELTAYGASRALADASGARVGRGPIGILPNGAAFDGSGTGTLIVDSIGGFVARDIIDMFDGVDEQLTNLMAITAPNRLSIQPGPVSDFAPGAQVYRITRAMTITSVSGTTLTLNSTQGLLSGDVLHLTDQVNSEDVTVKQVTSATVLTTTATIAHSYAAGSPATLSTPFYRYKAIDPLVRELFNAAGISVAEVRLQSSAFNKLAPTPVNIQGLGVTGDARRGMAETVATTGGLNHWMASIAAVDSYSQGDPSMAWIVQGLTDKGPYDWSPYYLQGDAGPAFLLYEPVVGATQEAALGARLATYWGAADFYSATRRIWGLELGTSPGRFSEQTTVDGVTYTAPTFVALPASTTPSGATVGLDYDPTRNFCYVSWAGAGVGRFQYRDLGGAAWVDIKPTGDTAATRYLGPRYCADLDMVFVLKDTNIGGTGPNFTICAFRGATKLWERAFPACLIAQDVANNPCFYPTRTIRYINGSLYCVLVADGAVQLLRTDNQFQSYTMRTISPATSKTIIMACRVRDTYRIFCYSGTSPVGYLIAAPFYAGVIPYADFTGLSVSQALQNLAVLTNAVAWVDDDMQGHFVARDLLPVGPLLAIDDRVIQRIDVHLWDQANQYVTVSGGQVQASAGVADFSRNGLSVNSPLVPNAAFAQALADAYYAFYSKQRRMLETVLADRDGTIYQVLDRVTLEGIRYMVYESNHDLAGDQVSVQLLEDV